MLLVINPTHTSKGWGGGGDNENGGDGDGDEGDDMAAAANIWVKSLASWQIGVKTESKSNDARLVTRYITRQIENIERIHLPKLRTIECSMKTVFYCLVSEL